MHKSISDILFAYTLFKILECQILSKNECLYKTIAKVDKNKKNMPSKVHVY
ncbi:hypothetical protein ACJIZ3_020595 [Penstemon smallii]|uniref:Uncharacterized protein n=1 Tax=Penstemon smallii TaxID=265156 RepID=A0ABD3SJJ9_9LAMI